MLSFIDHIRIPIQIPKGNKVNRRIAKYYAKNSYTFLKKNRKTAAYAYKIGITQYIKSNMGNKTLKYLVSEFELFEMTSKIKRRPTDFLYGLWLPRLVNPR